VREANFKGGPKVEVKLSKVTSKRKNEKMPFYFKHDLSSLTLMFAFHVTQISFFHIPLILGSYPPCKRCLNYSILTL